MAIFAKMPGIGCNCLDSCGSDSGIICSCRFIRVDVTVAPIFSIGNCAEIIVAVEENMVDTRLVQFGMQLPNFIMCLLGLLFPVYTDHKFFIALLMIGWHIVHAAGPNLIVHIVNQPFFAFPGTPLYHHQHFFWVAYLFQPISSGS